MNAETQDLINRLVLYYIPVIFSLALHEYGHARVAVWLGDRTPLEEGRLTLNPVVHMQLFGSVLLPLAMILSGTKPMAWAKPVNTTMYRYTRKVRAKTAIMLVAAAGPAVNLLIALVVSLVLAWGIRHGHPWKEETSRVGTLLEQARALNIVLFLFNLIPFPPFDGNRVVKGFMSYEIGRAWGQLERFSWGFVGIFMLTGAGKVVLDGPSQIVSAGLDFVTHLFFH